MDHHSDRIDSWCRPGLYYIIEAETIIDSIITAVNQFQNGSGAEDDITLIVIKKVAG